MSGRKPIRDVAMRQLRGGDERAVLDLHPLVVRFVTRLESAQDRDRVLDAWLANHDGLEAAFECGILFDVLAVLVERRRADAA